MSDALRDLSLAYDGPIPRHEYAAARYGHRAHERITVGGDLSMHVHAARGYARTIKKLGRDDAAFGRLLAHCRFHIAQWRKLRAKYREIMREIEAVNADVRRGLLKQAAE